jgi:hypothetical protein
VCYVPSRRARGAPDRAIRRFPIEPRELAAAAAWIADQKKGLDIRVYEVAEQIKVADYFVLVT